VLGWLARSFARRDVSLVLIAAIAPTDLAVPWHEFGFLPRALVDEPCHLATAGIVLAAITRLHNAPPGQRFGWAMLASSVLIDLDHLPLEFGSSALTAGTPRPYTHALWVVVVLAAAAIVAARWSRRRNGAAAMAAASLLASAACGVSAHFLRNIATAPMSLCWPVSNAAVQVPYRWYLGSPIGGTSAHFCSSWPSRRGARAGTIPSPGVPKSRVLPEQEGGMAHLSRRDPVERCPRHPPPEPAGMPGRCDPLVTQASPHAFACD
jgi:inner membrane protein